MEVFRSIWLFIQNQILGMKWLNEVIGNTLNAYCAFIILQSTLSHHQPLAFNVSTDGCFCLI